jgi:hypothetical protein
LRLCGAGLDQSKLHTAAGISHRLVVADALLQLRLSLSLR